MLAYLHEPMPARGTGRLRAQKSVVDALAAGVGRHLRRYVVDSGSRVTAAGRGANLEALLAEARNRPRATTLLVASVDVLALYPKAARLALMDLLVAGFSVKDPSGELRPTPSTIALAKAFRDATVEKRRSRGPDNA